MSSDNDLLLSKYFAIPENIFAGTRMVLIDKFFIPVKMDGKIEKNITIVRMETITRRVLFLIKYLGTLKKYYLSLKPWGNS